ICRLLPRPHGLPRYGGGSASALRLSRPAQTSLTLRPAQLLNRPRRPLSRGSSPASYPAKPLVSYRSKSTTLRVAPAATGHTRPRGALHKFRSRNGRPWQMRVDFLVELVDDLGWRVL